MVCGVLITALIETFGEKFGLISLLDKIKSLPLAEFGFTWFIPSLVCFVIGYILGMMGLGKRREEDVKESIF